MNAGSQRIFLPIEWLTQRLVNAPRSWLFIDYDGTLAEFAPSPDIVSPNPELIGLLTKLAAHPSVRLSIISGRRLDQIQALVPVPGLMLAGTYGIELQEMEGGVLQRVEFDSVRPVLESLKSQFLELLQGRAGFFLEDKGWSIAIHARYAAESDAEEVILKARTIAEQTVPKDVFRFLGGTRFYEVSSKLGNKGQTVSFLLDRYPWPEAALVYIGDDDKDEEAFEVIKHLGGESVIVSRQPRMTRANYRLESPEAVRAWLENLDERLTRRQPIHGKPGSSSTQPPQDPGSQKQSR